MSGQNHLMGCGEVGPGGALRRAMWWSKFGFGRTFKIIWWGRVGRAGVEMGVESCVMWWSRMQRIGGGVIILTRVG